MLDRTIPYCNMILRCDAYSHREVLLPEGFSIRGYEPGLECVWAELEFSIGDFSTRKEAKDYFNDAYLKEEVLLQKNACFLFDPDGKVVGSCIAWKDQRRGREIASLHWLVVAEGCQGMGLGRALCCAVMNLFAAQGRLPVYLHTQPWSWKAVFLYLSLGFRLQKTDSFAGYPNETAQGLTVLKTVVDGRCFAQLERCCDP